MIKGIFHIWLVLILFTGCKPDKIGKQVGTFHAESERFWELFSPEALAERIGIRFEFTEGPAWHPDGELIFSDIPENTIYRLKGSRFLVYRNPSNFSNGLLAMKDGSVFACEHGSRSVTRIAPDGSSSTLADNYMGKKLNSPNDLCRSSQGIIYFTDPPWGLAGLNEDPEKELAFSGVFMLKNGEVSLLDSTLSWPNGIALSPDERFLYVANFEGSQDSDPGEWEAFWMRYELDPEGKVVKKSLFFQAQDLSLPGGPDGMKVDKKGNLFATGPGGILVIAPDGEHLGTIGLPQIPSNLAFGPGEKELYVTARSSIVRIKLK
ncbi:MAG: SMP-30/gluconolactonase/LRE family protein [Bacteroides sp.]|nr:SMP-30/gluconolactonase/LRE family protein [Bacteroides sp.]